MRALLFDWACVAASLSLVAGCATFHPLPLDSSHGPVHVADLTVSAASMPTSELRAYPFDPANGLDVTEVAMLAVANSPQLKVQRDAAGIANAQAYAAGLLPDPQLSYSHDNPTGNDPPGTFSSFSTGLTFDLGNLVTRSARVHAARASAHEVDLTVLWSEWQTITQARTLFDQVYFLHKHLARLQRERAALAPVRNAITRALQAGDLTYEVAGAGLNAAADVSDQLGSIERQLHLAEHDLHLLLGLDAGVALHLTGGPFSVDPDPAAVHRALAEMTQHRPDLLALQAGYRAQNEKLRVAILSQFPAITVGFTKARDNSNSSSAGFTIGISLPLFNGNRGNIAIERATRQQLHDAYNARRLTARNDIQRLTADLASDRVQHEALALHTAQLDRARKAAQSNFAAGRLDWPTYLAIRASSLASDTTLLTLEENIHTAAIALDALVGNWPSIYPAATAHAPTTATSFKNGRS